MLLRNGAHERFTQVLKKYQIKKWFCEQTGQPLLTRHAEMAQRDGGRVDSRYGMDAAPFCTMLRRGGAAARLIPLLCGVLGDDAEVVAKGQVVAMSSDGWIRSLGEDGFGDQEWHTDGRNGDLPPAHALTVFIPLCDVTLTNGPTQFILGSHRTGESRGQDDVGATDEARAARATTFHPRAGSAIAFDYRLWHRGLLNAGLVDRPVLYFIVGRPIWKDGCKGLPRLDLGTTSLFTGLEVDPMPPFRLNARSTSTVTANGCDERTQESDCNPAPRRSNRYRKRPR